MLCSTDWGVSLQAELEVSPCATAPAQHSHWDTQGCPAVQKGHTQGHSAAPAKSPSGKNSNLSSELGHALANQSGLSAKASLLGCLICHYFRSLMSSLWGGEYPNETRCKPTPGSRQQASASAAPLSTEVRPLTALSHLWWPKQRLILSHPSNDALS